MGTRALSIDPWTHLTSAGVIDACALAELVSRLYPVTYVSSLALVGDDFADRYVVLDARGDDLCVTLWTHGGGRRGHAVRFALAEYNTAAGRGRTRSGADDPVDALAHCAETASARRSTGR